MGNMKTATGQTNMIRIAEWLATAGTIIGLYLLSENNIQGFSVGLFSNILWMYWANETKSNGIFFVNVVLLIINLNGLGVV